MEPLYKEQTSRTVSSDSSDEQEYRPSKLRQIGILLFGIFIFFVFLILKLPEARIQNFIVAHIRIAAQEQGFLFSAEKIRIGLLLGPSIKMYNVELKSIDDNRQKLTIPFLRARPQLLSLLSQTKKVSIAAELLGGEISGSVGASNAALVANLDIESIDLSQTSILKKYLPMDIAGKISGEVRLDLDLEQTQKSDGRINLKIEKLNLPPQNVYGFNLPKLNISESVIEATIAQGQLVLRKVELGKDIKTDDVLAKATGDGAIDRILARSRLNLKVIFDLSQSVKQSLPLLEQLLGPAKAPDGKFSYRITGPLTSLEAQPGG